jgi:hypothetical protein
MVGYARASMTPIFFSQIVAATGAQAIGRRELLVLTIRPRRNSALPQPPICSVGPSVWDAKPADATSHIGVGVSAFESHTKVTEVTKVT